MPLLLKSFQNRICHNKTYIQKLEKYFSNLTLNEKYKIKLNTILFEFKSTYAQSTCKLQNLKIYYDKLKNIKYLNNKDVIAYADICYKNNCKKFYVYAYNLKHISYNPRYKFRIKNTILDLLYYKAYNYFNPARDDEDFKRLLKLLKSQVYCEAYLNNLYNNLKISEKEIKNYYEIHKNNFIIPAKADFFIFVYDNETLAKKVFNILKTKYKRNHITQKNFNQIKFILKNYPPKKYNMSMIEEGKNPILDFWIFKENKDICLLKDGKYYYLIVVNRKLQKEIYSYQKVKPFIESKLKLKKLQEYLNTLINK